MAIRSALRRYFHFWHVCECFVVKAGIVRPLLDELFLLAQLMYAYSRENVAQVVLKPAFDNFVVPVSILSVAVPRVFTNSMQTKNLHFIEQFLVMRDHHSTLARR